ncbi:hypothetical protein AB4Z22_18610 [Paenibacillus sp. TAF58]
MIDVAAEINASVGVTLNCQYFSEAQWNIGEGIIPNLKESIEKKGFEWKLLLPLNNS